MTEQTLCPIQKFLQEKNRDYHVEQISTSCLSQYAYYIESEGEAILIDPMRDIEDLLLKLKERKAKLKYIFETHYHADFVSGHFDLSEKTKTKIIFGPNAKATDKIYSAKDEEIFEVGKIKIKILHTPGHTMESSCFLLIDSQGKERVLFTGDTIFLGEVGRPDLAVKSDLTEKDLAALLFDSVQKVKKLNDDLLIFPGHGAGSACGKNISSGNGDTLGNQKKTNYALSDTLNKEEFIDLVTLNLPKPPSYFFHDAKMNKEGYEDIDKLLEETVRPLDYKEFLRLSKEENTFVIDTRNGDVSSRGFFRNSFLISLSVSYAVWVAKLFKPENKLIFITEEGKEKESILRLFRVGYYNTLGYLDGGFDTVKKSDPENVDEIARLEYTETNQKFSEGKIDLVDIREFGEFESTGVLEKSHLMPLGDLQNNIETFRNVKNPIGVFCRSGARAVIGSSIFKRSGFKETFIVGGFESIKNTGLKCVKYLKK